MVRDQDQTLTGKLFLAGAPTQDLEAVTKRYVDSVVQGLDPKASVRIATSENITLSGVATIQTVELAAGDRVLVMNQTNKTQNGIYVVAEGAWSRAEDANTSADVTPGMFTFVEEGTYASSGFVLSTKANIELGTTELEFSQFSGAGQITAGTGLIKEGNAISLGNSGVTAGTYTKVTVDVYGRVTTATEQITEDDIAGSISWAKISGAPTSTVAEIDDAVAKRHAHANATQLGKIAEEDGTGRLLYTGRKVAMADECEFTAVSKTEPTDLSVGGIWFQEKTLQVR